MLSRQGCSSSRAHDVEVRIPCASAPHPRQRTRRRVSHQVKGVSRQPRSGLALSSLYFGAVKGSHMKGTGLGQPAGRQGTCAMRSAEPRTLRLRVLELTLASAGDSGAALGAAVLRA